MLPLRAVPVLAIGLLLSNTPAPVAAGMIAAAAKCTGGWSGTINYSRNQSQSQNKTVQRLSGKGEDKTNWSMTYDYGARISVRPAPDTQQSLGRANIGMTSVSTETTAARDRDICPHERVSREMSGNFVTKSQTQAEGSGLEADVNIGEDSDGTYSISVILPEIKGTVSGSSSSSYSGQCKAKEGRNQAIADMPTTIDGVRFASSGEDQLPASDPNRLSGSHSVTWSGVTETLSWNLRRCGGALRLVDLKFEDMRFPNWEDWQSISEQVGTIDGNIVRLTAMVANDGPEEKAATVKFRDTYKGDRWDGAKPDGLLGEVTVSVPPGEEREVSFKWDSSGYAWYDDGRPRPVQRVKAEVEDKGKKADDMTRNLKVAPKPVILVHGLWSNWQAWESWQNILTTSHSYDWKAFPVGQRPEHGRMRTGEEVGNFGPTYSIDQNAEQLAHYIDYAQKDRNAWHVDIVAHSMGGLISRRYIHATMPIAPDGKPRVSHLVMLGTPNAGSPCADYLSIPLEAAGRSMEALRELRPSVVRQFNAVHVNRKGVPFSVFVGNPVPPPLCRMFSMSDGVVAEASAMWTIDDHVRQGVLHTDMTGTGPFSDFVKPRLALGPGRQGASGKASASGSGGGGGGGGAAGSSRVMLVEFAGQDEEAEAGSDFSKIVTLAPGETLEVEIPVKQARNLGVTFVAANIVSATLVDESGAVAATSLKGTPEASQLFRSLYVGRPVAQGRWTLRLKNDGETEREVIVSTWSTAG